MGLHGIKGDLGVRVRLIGGGGDELPRTLVFSGAAAMRTSFATLLMIAGLSVLTGCQSMKDCFFRFEAWKKETFCNHSCFGSAPVAAPVYAVPMVQQACPQPAPCPQVQCQPICQPICCETSCDPCAGGMMTGGNVISSGQPTLNTTPGIRLAPQPAPLQ